MEHASLVDWVSFTIPRSDVGCVEQRRHIVTDDGEVIYDQESVQDYQDLLDAVFYLRGILPDLPCVAGEGRKGFKTSLRMPTYEPQTVTIFGGHPDIFLIEITGKGCEKLRQQGRLQKLLEAFWHAVTRIDIAHDLKCETRPLAFAQERGNNRFKSQSHMQSRKGETCYIGSPTSDLMVRVYRYEPPHPRSDKLRIEYVARREQAKIVAERVASEGVNPVSQALGSRLKWHHRSYPSSDVPPLTSYQSTATKSAGTIQWLDGAVRPAIKRLISTGELTQQQVLEILELA